MECLPSTHIANEKKNQLISNYKESLIQIISKESISINILLSKYKRRSESFEFYITFQ